MAHVGDHRDIAKPQAMARRRPDASQTRLVVRDWFADEAGIGPRQARGSAAGWPFTRENRLANRK